jgi:hypothetical protein
VMLSDVESRLTLKKINVYRTLPESVCSVVDARNVEI